MADILKLVQTTQRERVDVAAFLREWADAIENDGETVAAVLIVLGEVGSKIRVRSPRCNMDLMKTLGLMQLATADLCDCTVG